MDVQEQFPQIGDGLQHVDMLDEEMRRVQIAAHNRANGFPQLHDRHRCVHDVADPGLESQAAAMILGNFRMFSPERNDPLFPLPAQNCPVAGVGGVHHPTGTGISGRSRRAAGVQCQQIHTRGLGQAADSAKMLGVLLRFRRVGRESVPMSRIGADGQAVVFQSALPAL